ncbi:uncharacterized protein LOC128216196 [Mya arenaria]|uniref:uncharacterized protein LOC128216196 n=1 Tax=Mya arenaria TaxID=6604 RepID=UPI0022E3D6CC|nr:uncharacterized protein LOC128216196 [Mya arenaria]
MGNCQSKEISGEVSPEEDTEGCISSEDPPSSPPSEKHLTVHGIESVVRDLHPGQYPRLAPGGIAFQVGGGPGQIPDRIVNRLRRKGGDKTKIGFPHNVRMPLIEINQSFIIYYSEPRHQINSFI